MPLLSWAAVGQIPRHVSLQPANRIHLKDVPLKKVPPWLGIDRALAGWGAFAKAKSSTSNSSEMLVADAGTVLSLTRISANGEFTGGQLAAGLRLQLSAMSEGTENLKDPGPSKSSCIQKFPLTTSEAMHKGSLQSLLGIIVEALRGTEMPLWLCGGDGHLLYPELKSRNLKIFHHPNLVLEGMVNLQK